MQPRHHHGGAGKAPSSALSDNAVLPGSFLTALLGRLDLRTGGCSLLNAGHVPPLLVRDGDTVLADDATLLILDWHSGHAEERNTSAGAVQTQASAALPH